uniref:Uncharacterized protein n=1 Tax=Chenopodium quinoa TaxID=63459 RepID=A0A803MAV6_CHEQI
MKFNHTEYFCSHSYVNEFNQLPMHEFHSKLCSNPENGSTYGTPFWVMRNLITREVQPAYMPLIDDAAGYLHMGVVLFMKWFCRRACPSTHCCIPKELIPIFDLKAFVDLDQTPTFSLPSTTREIVLVANKVWVHVMEAHTPFSTLTVTVHSDVTCNSGTRYFTVGIKANTNDILDNNLKFNKGMLVVVWNARSIHRPSFNEYFKELHDRYSPMLVIITEARGRRPLFNFVQTKMVGNYRIEAIGPSSDLGGVLLVWALKVELYITSRQDTLYGFVTTVTCIPKLTLHMVPEIVPE